MMRCGCLPVLVVVFLGFVRALRAVLLVFVGRWLSFILLGIGDPGFGLCDRRACSLVLCSCVTP